MITFPKELLVDIKKHLEEERAHVLQRIDELKKQDPFSDSERLNDNAASDTEAAEESDHDRFEALINELGGKKDALDAALRRIEDGSYGKCAHCGNLIDTDRLAAIPTATLCMQCEALKKAK